MTEQELYEVAMAKIEKALSMELPAETTAMYLQAFAMLTNGKSCSCKEIEVMKV